MKRIMLLLIAFLGVSGVSFADMHESNNTPDQTNGSMSQMPMDQQGDGTVMDDSNGMNGSDTNEDTSGNGDMNGTNGTDDGSDNGDDSQEQSQ